MTSETTEPAAVSLAPQGAGENSEWAQTLQSVAEDVAALHGEVDAALAWAARTGAWAPKPGGGETAHLWELFATTAAVNVGVARVLEPHLDALAILAQAPDPVGLDAIGADDNSTWGVYAAEGAGIRVTATEQNGGWTLDGVKPWCSLAAAASHALVTAYTADGIRRLFAVNLRNPDVHAEDGPWIARGMRQIVSAPVNFTGAPAVPVGPDGWYLERPGFAWGGIGVAACWWGGAVGVARAVYSGTQRREPDQIALMHLGAIDTTMNAARAVLAETSRLVDETDARTDAATAAIAAARARNLIAAAAESTIERVGHALGPAPLALDEEHAGRVADLQIYLRQHHAERDEAALGRDLAALRRLPW